MTRQIEMADATFRDMELNEGGTVLLPAGAQPVLPVRLMGKYLGTCYNDSQGEVTFHHPMLGFIEIRY